jgi:conjugal transfer pilus assembly protein TraE
MSFFKPKQKDDDDKPKKNNGLTVMAYTDLMKSKKTYHIVISTLSITVLILVIMLSSKNTEVVVMPPNYYEPVIISDGYANQSYAAGHAVGIALLIGNVSPKNIDFVTNTLQIKLSPALQVSLSNTLDTEAKLIKRRRARQIFEVEDVMFRNADGIVWVWGTKETTISANTIREPFTYEFRIVPNHGEPKVTHFDAYPGRPKIRGEEPVEVTPYLTRNLSLVKAFSPGEITISEPIEQSISEDEEPASIDTPLSNNTNPSQEGE